MLRPIYIPDIEIGEELGHGAHSVVYRAMQGSTPCAVKILRSRGRWSRWVYREAVALARVRHPSLPAVLEVGEADDLPYLVMELVEGETLADRLRRGPLARESAVDVAMHLADALAAVHAAGLVHRDVKPRNIVLERSGRVRLVDFGFAAPIGRASSNAAAVGTPGYSAPEQFRSPSRVDGRADLYALGRVIEDCLSSQGDASGASAAASLAQIASDLVADSPEDRYPDARSVWNDLASVQAGEQGRGPTAYRAVRYAAPLVGRDAELKRLAGAWTDIGPRGGSTIVLCGARGSGKTHLLARTATNARASASGCVLEVRCSDGDAPLAALRQVFEAFLVGNEHGPVGLRAAQEDALRAVATDHLASFANLIAPTLTDVLGEQGIVPEAGPEAFAEGAAEMLVRLARRVGRLLVSVDDFQWIDPVSRDVLIRLAHRVHETPLLLVIGTRAGFDGSTSDPLEMLPRARCPRLDLRPLTEPQVAALIASHLGETLVEPALVRRIATLAGGTPLGVLEVLGAFLDVGAIRPHARSWKFDVARAERVVLPAGALAFLGHRLGELPLATRTVLEAAAILGTTFEEALLGSVVGIGAEDLEYALADGRRAGIIEGEAKQSHRFVHDSLREMVAGALAAAERCRLHQLVAETLDRQEVSTLELLCARALHFAAGEIGKTPSRAYHAARAAADAALERYDNEMALRFLDLARVAATKGDLVLDVSFHRSLGEAQLRLGALDESLVSLEAALHRSHDRETRAALLGRIAWVYQTRSDPDLAWASLARAFDAVGASMPTNSATSAVHTFGQLARSELRRFGDRGTPTEAAARLIDVLCELHYQNARLGMEYAKPLPLIQSALEARRLSGALGSSRAQARASAMYGVVLTAMGRHSAGASELAKAQAMASELADPVTRAFCLQLQAMAAGWTGGFDRSLELMRECVDVHGHWLELNEYCHNAASADFMQSLRGRAADAWSWISRAVERLRRSHRNTTVLAPNFIHRARAALASLGRSVTEDPWLAARVDALSKEQGPGQSYFEILSWGPRARFLVESGELGASFESLVSDFERERHNPRSAHIMVAEYYVAVAHGRINQCLRARAGERAKPVRALRRAASDLRAAAKIPLLKAHQLATEAYLAWFDGSTRRANQLLGEAEAVANRESCSWVLYAVARARAHMLREEGRPDAARDQARVAEMLARAHGAEPRARWIREELGLPAPPSPGRPSIRSSHSSASHRARRQLASLLHVVGGAYPGLRPSEHASAILENLLRDLDAEAGVLWFQPDLSQSGGVLVGRNRAGDQWSEAKDWRDAIIRDVRATGEPWTPGSNARGAPAMVDFHVDPLRVLAFPLFVYEDAVGAVCLERRPNQPPFSLEDRELLDLVSHQVPIALEMARLLEERAQLQASLQQVQKMDAVGELAGGVAHDFNNMLAVVRASLDHLGSYPDLQSDVAEELGIISQAADRAAQLTRRLLSFSRHHPALRTEVDVNVAIRELVPMLERVVGERAKVDVRLTQSVHTVHADRAAFEQALVNLIVNARDAMRDGGTVILSTTEITLDEESARRGLPKPGEYVLIEVGDTGEGITPEVVSRVFDPFFTTKGSGGGTGLGLTMVYAFAKNNGGHVSVESEVGRGTTFRVYLPRSRNVGVTAASDGRAAEAGNAPAPPKAHRDDLAILVVDDDRLVRDSVRRILHRGGYRVLTAGSGAEALEIIGRLAAQISLVVVDVMMPEMSGPEVARRLADLGVPAKILFISGYAPANLPVGLGEITSGRLLQKPFAGAELLRRVGQLVED